MMDCKCICQPVCNYCDQIQEAFRSIIEIYIPGPNPDHDKVEKLVQSVCKYRKPIRED